MMGGVWYVGSWEVRRYASWVSAKHVELDCEMNLRVWFDEDERKGEMLLY